MHSRCMNSEGPRSEPWLVGLLWPTCSPGLRSKCPAPALLSFSPSASQLRSIPKQTFMSARHLPCTVMFIGSQMDPCPPAVCSRASRLPSTVHSTLAPPPTIGPLPEARTLGGLASATHSGVFSAAVWLGRKPGWRTRPTLVGDCVCVFMDLCTLRGCLQTATNCLSSLSR